MARSTFEAIVEDARTRSYYRDEPIAILRDGSGWYWNRVSTLGELRGTYGHVATLWPDGRVTMNKDEKVKQARMKVEQAQRMLEEARKGLEEAEKEGTFDPSKARVAPGGVGAEPVAVLWYDGWVVAHLTARGLELVGGIAPRWAPFPVDKNGKVQVIG